MVGRWLRSQLLLVVVIILQCSTMIDGQCKGIDMGPGVYNYVDGECIYISNATASFDDAIAACQARNVYPLNWTLVKVESKRKFDWLVEFSTYRNTTMFWIGLRRDNATTEDERRKLDQWRNWAKWRWLLDGSTLKTSFVGETVPWADNEPDNHFGANESCVVHISGIWRDRPCNWGHSFMCGSIDVSTTTTSTTSTTTTTTTTAPVTTPATTSTSTTAATTTSLSTATIQSTTTATTPATKTTPPTTTAPTTTATSSPTPGDTSAEESTTSTAVLFSTTPTSIGISNSTPQGVKEATTPNHLAIGLGIGIAGLFVALIMIVVLIVGIILVRRRRRRRAFRAGSDMTTRIFSATSDQSGIFKLDGQEKPNKRAKKGSEESSYSAVLPPSKMESSLSMKRESPKKKKGPSASMKKLYEKWAAIDAREAKTTEMTKMEPENLPLKKSGKSVVPNTNVIKSNVPKKQPGKSPTPGSTAVCPISKKSKGAKVIKQSGKSSTLGSSQPSNKSEALSKRPGKMPSPLARSIISPSRKFEDATKSTKKN